MSNHDHADLPCIAAENLANVTGGAHRPGHNDAQLQVALKGITDSLEVVAEQKNSGGSNLSQLVPLMMFAKGGAGAGCAGGNCGR